MDIVFRNPLEKTPNYILKDRVYGDDISAFFGWSLSNDISGHVLIMGGYGDDSNGTNAGAAIVFTGDGNNKWVYKQKIKGSFAGDQYGISVTNNNDASILIIGGNLIDNYTIGGVINAGGAAIYTGNKNQGWGFKQMITGDSAGDQYGRSVATNADGSVIVLGGDFDDDAGFNAGAALIYTGSSNSFWRIKQKITGDSPTDYYGSSVSTNNDGSIIIMGGRLDDDNGSNAGAALIFTGNKNQGWKLKQKIVGDYAGNFLGVSTAVNHDGSVIVLGQDGDDENGLNAGAVSIFTGNKNNGWALNQKLLGENPGDLFGKSVSINNSGNFIIIGAHNNDQQISNAGAGYIYEQKDSNWVLQEKILGIDFNSFYGYSVGINYNGNAAFLGGYNARNEIGNAVGGILIYQANPLKDYIFTHNQDFDFQFLK